MAEDGCFLETKRFTQLCVVSGRPDKLPSWAATSTALLLQWCCCLLPSTLEFNPVCSSKKKNVFIVWEAQSLSPCFTASSAGTVRGRGAHKQCPARRVQVPHPTCISSLFAGGWQQCSGRWFHPLLTSQRATVRFLSQSAGFHSDIYTSVGWDLTARGAQTMRESRLRRVPWGDKGKCFNVQQFWLKTLRSSV